MICLIVTVVSAIILTSYIHFEIGTYSVYVSNLFISIMDFIARGRFGFL